MSWTFRPPIHSEVSHWQEVGVTSPHVCTRAYTGGRCPTVVCANTNSVLCPGAIVVEVVYRRGDSNAWEVWIDGKCTDRPLERSDPQREYNLPMPRVNETNGMLQPVVVAVHSEDGAVTVSSARVTLRATLEGGPQPDERAVLESTLCAPSVPSSRSGEECVAASMPYPIDTIPEQYMIRLSREAGDDNARTKRVRTPIQAMSILERLWANARRVFNPRLDPAGDAGTGLSSSDRKDAIAQWTQLQQEIKSYLTDQEQIVAQTVWDEPITQLNGVGFMRPDAPQMTGSESMHASKEHIQLVTRLSDGEIHTFEFRIDADAAAAVDSTRRRLFRAFHASPALRAAATRMRNEYVGFVAEVKRANPFGTNETPQSLGDKPLETIIRAAEVLSAVFGTDGNRFPPPTIVAPVATHVETLPHVVRFMRVQSVGITTDDDTEESALIRAAATTMNWAERARIADETARFAGISNDKWSYGVRLRRGHREPTPTPRVITATWIYPAPPAAAAAAAPVPAPPAAFDAMYRDVLVTAGLPPASVAVLDAAVDAAAQQTRRAARDEQGFLGKIGLGDSNVELLAAAAFAELVAFEVRLFSIQLDDPRIEVDGAASVAISPITIARRSAAAAAAFIRAWIAPVRPDWRGLTRASAIVHPILHDGDPLFAVHDGACARLALRRLASWYVLLGSVPEPQENNITQGPYGDDWGVASASDASRFAAALASMAAKPPTVHPTRFPFTAMQSLTLIGSNANINPATLRKQMGSSSVDILELQYAMQRASIDGIAARGYSALAAQVIAGREAEWRIREIARALWTEPEIAITQTTLTLAVCAMRSARPGVVDLNPIGLHPLADVPNTVGEVERFMNAQRNTGSPPVPDPFVGRSLAMAWANVLRIIGDDDANFVPHCRIHNETGRLVFPRVGNGSCIFDAPFGAGGLMAMHWGAVGTTWTGNGNTMFPAFSEHAIVWMHTLTASCVDLLNVQHDVAAVDQGPITQVKFRTASCFNGANRQIFEGRDQRAPAVACDHSHRIRYSCPVREEQQVEVVWGLFQRHHPPPPNRLPRWEIPEMFDPSIQVAPDPAIQVPPPNPPNQQVQFDPSNPSHGRDPRLLAPLAGVISDDTKCIMWNAERIAQAITLVEGRTRAPQGVRIDVVLPYNLVFDDRTAMFAVASVAIGRALVATHVVPLPRVRIRYSVPPPLLPRPLYNAAEAVRATILASPGVPGATAALQVLNPLVAEVVANQQDAAAQATLATATDAAVTSIEQAVAAAVQLPPAAATAAAEIEAHAFGLSVQRAITKLQTAVASAAQNGVRYVPLAEMALAIAAHHAP